MPQKTTASLKPGPAPDQQHLRGLTPPRQQRSQASLDRMMAAAEALIAEHGISRLTIAETVRVAESSNGAFYSRFADKQAFVRAVQDRFLTRIETEWLQRLAQLETTGLDAPQTGRLIAIDALAIFRRHAPLIRAFIYFSGADEAVLARAGEAHRKIIAAIDTLLAKKFGLPPIKADILYRLLTGLLEQVIAHEPADGPVDWQELSVQLQDVAAAYLATDTKPAP